MSAREDLVSVTVVTQHLERQHTVIRVSFTVRVDSPQGAQRRQFLIIPKTQKRYTAEELRGLAPGFTFAQEHPPVAMANLRLSPLRALNGIALYGIQLHIHGFGREAGEPMPA
jgi:hypothetical protein